FSGLQNCKYPDWGSADFDGSDKTISQPLRDLRPWRLCASARGITLGEDLFSALYSCSFSACFACRILYVKVRLTCRLRGRIFVSVKKFGPSMIERVRRVLNRSSAFR